MIVAFQGESFEQCLLVQLRLQIAVEGVKTLPKAWPTSLFSIPSLLVLNL